MNKYLALIGKMEEGNRHSERFSKFMDNLISFRNDLAHCLVFSREGHRQLSSSSYLEAANLVSHIESDIIAGNYPREYESVVKKMQVSKDRVYDLSTRRLDKLEDEKRKNNLKLKGWEDAA